MLRWRKSKFRNQEEAHGDQSHVSRFEMYSLKQLKEKSCIVIKTSMVTLSNKNIFRVTDHLCGEFTGHRTPNQVLRHYFQTFAKRF